MQLLSEYKFNLKQNILPGRVAIGKFNSSSTYLVAALTGGKVLVTNLWSVADNAISKDIPSNILNINQTILSLKTGHFNKLSHDKDLIFVGTSSSLLVYDVENNSDVFYKEIADGVSCCEVGKLGKCDDNVVVIGGSCSLAAFDYAGDEVLWSVTGDNVTSLAIVDVQNKGYNELIVGSEDFEIRVFHEDDIINEMTETETVTNLCALGGSMFGYGLANGTVGVYDRYNRLWRIKSKSIPVVILGFDINDDGVIELITGWSNGKIDVRSIDSGEVLFKDHMKCSIAGIDCVSHPQYSGQLLLVCSNDGEVRIYKKVTATNNSYSGGVINQDYIYELNLKKQNLLMELKTYENSTSISQHPDASYVMAIPTDTSVNFTMQLVNTQNKVCFISIGYASLILSKKFSRVLNFYLKQIMVKFISFSLRIYHSYFLDVLVRCVMIFAEGIFEGESHVVHPPIHKLSTRLPVIIVPPKDVAVDLHMKVIVGYKTGNQFHIFEMIRSLPKFSMYQYVAEGQPFKKPTGYVQFQVQERLHRFILWVNQNFLLEKEIELKSKDQTELLLRFVSARENIELEININSKTNQVIVSTENIEFAGNIVQSLCEYLNVEDLSSVCNFPTEFNHLNDVISKIDGIQASHQRMTSDIADSSNIIKNFIVRAEDCRLMRHMPGMNKCYSELLTLNRELINRYRIRCNNHQELLNYLKFINSFIQQGGNLRVGRYRTQVVASCRQAVKDNHLNKIDRLIKTGTD